MWKFGIGVNHVVTLVTKPLPVRPRPKGPQFQKPHGIPACCGTAKHPCCWNKKKVHALGRWHYSPEIRCVNRHLLRMWLLLRDSRKLQPSQWLQVDISFCNLLPPPQWKKRQNVQSMVDEKRETLLSLSAYLHIALIVIAVSPDQLE